jgi:hypothetical protein
MLTTVRTHNAVCLRRQKIDVTLKRFWFNNIVACCFNVKQTLLESVLKQRWRSEKTLKKRWDRNLRVLQLYRTLYVYHGRATGLSLLVYVVRGPPTRDSVLVAFGQWCTRTS